MIQAMTREAGFDVKIQATEAATALNMAEKGDFEAWYALWSGRIDPDGNLWTFIGCDGPLNNSRYCKPEVEALLKAERTSNDPAVRAQAFASIAGHVLDDRPVIYLFHRKWLYGYTQKLSGFREYPDGLVRVQGLKLN